MTLVHFCFFFTLYFFVFIFFWIWYFCIFCTLYFRKFGFAFSFVFCIFAIGFVLLRLCFSFFRNNFICLLCILLNFPLRPNMYIALFCIFPFVQKSHFILLCFCRLLVPASLRATPNAALQATSRNHRLLTLWTLTLGNTENITLGNTENIIFHHFSYLIT